MNANVEAEPVMLVAERGLVLEAVINRPTKRNALNQETAYALGELYERFEQGPWRVLIISGAGDKAFCAGADFNNPPLDDGPAYPNFGVKLTKPVIAAIEGYAVGAGFVLSQTSDIAVAGQSAQFAYPEASIGVTGGGATLLTTRVPTKVVTDLLLTSRFYPADRALAAGLVSEVVPDGQALAKARELADRIASNSADCVRALKALIDRDTQRSTVEGAQQVANVTRATKDKSVLTASRGIKGLASGATSEAAA